MNILVSWSKPRSEYLANHLRIWLADCITPLEPWMSSKDLRKGTAWFSEIHGELMGLKAAVVCVTSENLHEDWLLFEAGAAAGQGHPVFTYLLDLEPTQVKG